MSDAAWRRLFDADPAIGDFSLVLNGERYVLVGVLAGAALEFDADADFFVAFDPTALAPTAGAFIVTSPPDCASAPAAAPTRRGQPGRRPGDSDRVTHAARV